MSILERLKKAQERNPRPIKRDDFENNWRKMSTTNQHMLLMYLYRAETDLENIEQYLETFRFRQMNMQISDLPERIRNMTPGMLYANAYAVIGKEMPRLT
jgi:hypothetical protein